MQNNNLEEFALLPLYEMFILYCQAIRGYELTLIQLMRNG